MYLVILIKVVMPFCVQGALFLLCSVCSAIAFASATGAEVGDSLNDKCIFASLNKDSKQWETSKNEYCNKQPKDYFYNDIKFCYLVYFRGGC